MLLLAPTLFLTHHSSSQNPLEAMSRAMTNQEETSTILPIRGAKITAASGAAGASQVGPSQEGNVGGTHQITKAHPLCQLL